MPTDHPDSSQDFLKAFSDPEKVARYAEGPRRFVPGIEALHRMTGILLAERVPQDGTVLVLGAGGGLELKAMADSYLGWRFVGVDPSAEMLRMAAHMLGPHAPRTELIEGYIDDAPLGPFDGAVCLLTLHFLDAEERTRTVREIRQRLKPGAPFIAAHGSFPQSPTKERERWLSRYAAFAVSSGADPNDVAKAQASIAASLRTFSPEQDESILRSAGFSDLSLFYAAFTWRGWVAYA